MRKVIWCSTAAGLLSAGTFLSLAFYACRCPDSCVGRAMQVIAEASLAMQPLNSISTLAMHTRQTNIPTANQTGAVEEECIPDDPQPVAAERKPNEVAMLKEVEAEAAPIVIAEEDPMPRQEAEIVPEAPDNSQADIQVLEIAGKDYPVMPYCQADEKEAKTPPVMPSAEETAFKEWMKLLDADNKDKTKAEEQLPAPTEEEEPRAEPKCQEDSNLHEHYSGCPRVTCPYTGKSYPSCTPATKAGKEEDSEEPPHQSHKSHRHKTSKLKGEELPVPNVDTMEFRKSDAGLNEYGQGPLQ